MNNDKHWFRLNSYASGWIPVAWQGWAVLTAFALLILSYPVLAELGALDFEPLYFLLFVAAVLGAVMTVCYLKSEKN